MIKMPSKSYKGPLPALTEYQKTLQTELTLAVEHIAGTIGERNLWTYRKLQEAANFIESTLTQTGCEVRRQQFDVQAKTCCNIEVEIPGSEKKDEIVIVGAHYDSVFTSPGANDNGSGVAATLALARRFGHKSPQRTLRFVFFANEEPPFFQTPDMGSYVYAAACRAKDENIVAMLSLETIGCYCDEPNSQKYPFPFSIIYPDTGNFLGFVSDLSSRKLLRRVVASFRKNCKFPSEGGALPSFITGISWSDHWSFRQYDYPAIMVTDTAPFRYLYYHSAEDTPEKIDYERLARVVAGLEAVIADLTDL